MENRKYKVKRDDVHIGGVIKTSTIYRYSNDSKYNVYASSYFFNPSKVKIFFFAST